MAATDFAPKLNLIDIEATTKLPDLKVEKELPEHIDDLVVVVLIYYIISHLSS